PQLQKWNNQLEKSVHSSSQLYDDAVQIKENEANYFWKKEFNETVLESKKIYHNMMHSASYQNVYNSALIRNNWKNYKSTLGFMLVFRKADVSDDMLVVLNHTIYSNSNLFE